MRNMRIILFCLCASWPAYSCADVAKADAVKAQSAPGDERKLEGLPVTLVKDDIMSVTLLELKVTTKWKIYYPNRPFFEAPEGSEIVVVVFSRKPLKEGVELGPINMQMYDDKDQRLEHLAYVIVGGGKTERAFMGPKGTRLKAWKIDGLAFDLSQKLPRDGR